MRWGGCTRGGRQASRLRDLTASVRTCHGRMQQVRVMLCLSWNACLQDEEDDGGQGNGRADDDGEEDDEEEEEEVSRA